MTELALHSFHKDHGASFQEIHGSEAVAHYGNLVDEYTAVSEGVGIFDLSFRGRLCVLGADRIRFLHGQVTNDIKSLPVFGGCYSALTNAKGKLEGDLNIWRLEDELLIDFEPGLQETITARLEKYIVADDVQLAEVASLYGLISVQGPLSAALLKALGRFDSLPQKDFQVIKKTFSTGEVYIMNHGRTGASGFDLFIPAVALEDFVRELLNTKFSGMRLCGWQAFETARVEAGIPRFGADMDATNFPQECGIEARAVSYSKGCYIGQETLNRIHTMGHVNRELTGLLLENNSLPLPAKGEKLFDNGKDVGNITTAIQSFACKQKIALGYVRKGLNEEGKQLVLKTPTGENRATITQLPFRKTN